MTNSTLHHVAIVMDGNGRWAKKRLLPRAAGHKAGQKTVEKMIKAAIERDIRVLTLFAFSSENWQRPAAEVHTLMDMFMKGLAEHTPALHDKQVRLRLIGDRQRLDPALQQKIFEAESLTANNQRLQLVLAINYGGQLDITQAAQALAAQVHSGQLAVADITIERFNHQLYSGDLPPPDLFIRTSGELRLSNFLLWQLAYSELYFTETLWPDFSEKDLDLAIQTFSERKRRFGKV